MEDPVTTSLSTALLTLASGSTAVAQSPAPSNSLRARARVPRSRRAGRTSPADRPCSPRASEIWRRGALEVYGRGRLDGTPVRVGFSLRGPETAPAEALNLFVELGSGETKSALRRTIPPGANERATATLLRRLLDRAVRPSLALTPRRA